MKKTIIAQLRAIAVEVPEMFCNELLDIANYEEMNLAQVTVRVPVKKFVDDESLSFEERFNNLNQHHLAETSWLISELEKSKSGLDSDEVFEKACEHFSAACGHPTKEELEDAGAFLEPEERIKYMQIYNGAILRHSDSPKSAQDIAIFEVIQAYENDACRRNANDLEREIRHAMGHVFQDVLKPLLLGIPCEACSASQYEVPEMG